MTGKAKGLKIACICALLLGIVLAVLGIITLVQDGSLPAGATLADGVLMAVLGARCSMLANVPSNAGRLFKLALAAFVIALACAAVCIVRQDSHLYLAEATSVEAVVTLVMTILDRSIVNDQKQA